MIGYLRSHKERLAEDKKKKEEPKKEYKDYLDVNDIDKVIIEPVYENWCLKDIVVHFPEGYKNRDISFREVGLINLDGSIGYESEQMGTPIVTMRFYGRLKTSETVEF